MGRGKALQGAEGISGRLPYHRYRRETKAKREEKEKRERTIGGS